MNKSQIFNIIKNIAYIIALVYAANKGILGLFFIISSLILIIIYHKRLWAFIKQGSEMYVKKCQELGGKMENVYDKVKK